MYTPVMIVFVQELVLECGQGFWNNLGVTWS